MYTFAFLRAVLFLLRSGRANFVKPWKYTSAADDTAAAESFIPNMLHGCAYDSTYTYVDEDQDKENCIASAWFFWQDGTTNQVLAMADVFKDFHVHVVEGRRSGGPLTQEDFEQVVSYYSRNNTKYTAFMDLHITFETEDLDPIIVPLLQHGVPVFGQANADGSFSIFVQIPQSAVVEISSHHLTLVNLSVPDPCTSEPERVTKVDWTRALSYKYDRPRFAMRPKRMTFASTGPAVAAAFVASILGGEPMLELQRGSFAERCVQSHGIRLSNEAGVEFELVWTHRAIDKGGSGALAVFEKYVTEVRGNLSKRNWQNWEHFMDNHIGLIFDNCGPIKSRLEESGVEFFLAPQGDQDHIYASIFFQDQLGVLFEIVCVDWPCNSSEFVDHEDDDFDVQFCRVAGEDIKVAAFWACCENEDPFVIDVREHVASLALSFLGRATFDQSRRGRSVMAYRVEPIGSASLLVCVLSAIMFCLVLARYGAKGGAPGR